MSLRWRIALALGAVAAIVGAFAAFGSYVTTERQLLAGIDVSLRDRAQLANGVAPNGRPSPPTEPDPEDGAPRSRTDGGQTPRGCPLAGSLTPAAAAQLVAADGTVTPCLGTALTIPHDGLVGLGAGEYRLTTISIDHATYRVVSARWRAGGYIQIARNLDESDGVLNRLRLRLAGVALVGSLAAAGAGWLIAKRIVRPVVRLRSTAEAIASTQDLSTPIPIEGVGEVASLAKSFTTMVAALSTSRQQQTRLVADASHEMRTPLTSLRTNLELLDHFDQLSAADRHDTLAGAQVDVAELTHLLTELVDLAADPMSDREQPEAAHLHELVDEVVARSRRRSGRTIVVVSASRQGTATVTVRPQMLERAIGNLIDNAVKYSANGQPVEVVVGDGSVQVRDHGPGITEGDLPHIFERFYRSTLARSEPGSGLGLAIVRQIVERHGGQVSAVNHPDGGAVVGFHLPVDRPARSH
jgi:two-component system, OmpR family, sensor histidine kinase MprB